MKNKIYYVNSTEMSLIKKSFTAMNNVWVGEIDGKKVKNLNDYLFYISKLMEFPTLCKNLDAYEDWITDLDWLNASGYVLVINRFNSFMSEDLEKKKILLKLFEEDTLPWWEKEVEKCVVEGKAKPFNLYLVD